MVFSVLDCTSVIGLPVPHTHTVKQLVVSELVVRTCDIVGPVLVICHFYKADLKIRTHTTHVSEKIPE